MFSGCHSLVVFGIYHFWWHQAGIANFHPNRSCHSMAAWLYCDGANRCFPNLDKVPGNLRFNLLPPDCNLNLLKQVSAHNRWVLSVGLLKRSRPRYWPHAAAAAEIQHPATARSCSAFLCYWYIIYLVLQPRFDWFLITQAITMCKGTLADGQIHRTNVDPSTIIASPAFTQDGIGECVWK